MKNGCILLLALALPFASTAYAADCAAPPTFAGDDANDWTGWGKGWSNTRYVAEDAGGLSADDLDELELQWAFGFPDTGSVIGQPAIVGDTVLIGVDSGAVYALDAASGCVHWSFQAETGVRTSPLVADVDGTPTVFFGDGGAQFYAVDFASGARKWQVEVEAHTAAKLTGTPQLAEVGGTLALIVPVSSGEEGAAANPMYTCCSFRGSVVALNAASGAQLWKTYTITDEPTLTGDKMMGPSGGAIWSAPTIDVERGLLYVATGDAYSSPADLATDAVMALELDDGEIRWVAQDTANDIWTVACMRPNASDDCGPDHDFGAPPIMVEVDGKQLLVAGQKSGNVWAHDPEMGGVVWRSPLVEDTTEFGGKIIWGGASDGEKAYFGLGTGGVGAVRLSDGEKEWFTPLAPSTERARNVGQDGPLTVTGDVVLSGGWDGILRALSTANGEVLWEYDTVREFDTVNGVAAKGGSLGAAGPVVAGGRLFVPSGYVGVKNGMQGNVLLMFARD